MTNFWHKPAITPPTNDIDSTTMHTFVLLYNVECAVITVKLLKTLKSLSRSQRLLLWNHFLLSSNSIWNEHLQDHRFNPAYVFLTPLSRDYTAFLFRTRSLTCRKEHYAILNSTHLRLADVRFQRLAAFTRG